MMSLPQLSMSAVGSGVMFLLELVQDGGGGGGGGVYTRLVHTVYYSINPAPIC